MTSPRLGVVRKSMLTDPLLIKSPLGKTRSRGLTVPGSDFTFGMRSSWFSDGGVAEALSNWNVHARSEEPAQVPDFVSLNWQAVKAGIVTSKEMRQYQVEKAIVQSQEPPKHKSRTPQQPLPVLDIPFGVKNQEPTAMSSLLSHSYGQQWLDKQLRKERPSKQPTVKPGSVVETRTSLLRRSRPVPATKIPKQSRYIEVAPALDTFRDPEARRRALGTRSNLVLGQGHQTMATNSEDRPDKKE